MGFILGPSLLLGSYPLPPWNDIVYRCPFRLGYLILKSIFCWIYLCIMLFEFVLDGWLWSNAENKAKKEHLFTFKAYYLFKSKVNSIPVLNQLYLLLFLGRGDIDLQFGCNIFWSRIHLFFCKHLSLYFYLSDFTWESAGRWSTLFDTIF